MSRQVITVAPDAGVKVAAGFLADRGISALPVIDSKGRLVGIVSEADLLRLETRPDPRTQSTPLPPSVGSTPLTVADVMTKEVLTVSANSEVSQAARIMLDAGIKRLPVMRGRRVVGILSRRDLMKVIARPDDVIASEVVRRLSEAGLGVGTRTVTVAGGVVTVDLDDAGHAGRLTESVVLTVPGVLEVRFVDPEAR